MRKLLHDYEKTTPINNQHMKLICGPELQNTEAMYSFPEYMEKKNKTKIKLGFC